jgi:hypothetical protein
VLSFNTALTPRRNVVYPFRGGNLCTIGFLRSVSVPSVLAMLSPLMTEYPRSQVVRMSLWTTSGAGRVVRYYEARSFIEARPFSVSPACLARVTVIQSSALIGKIESMGPVFL